MEAAKPLIEIFSTPEVWLSVIASFPVLAMAFSETVRKKIMRRANGRDEITGLPISRGDAAHFNHNRDAPEYDDQENGLFVSLLTHWWMHLLDEDNGLTDAQNEWAREKIEERMQPTEEEKYIFGRWLKKEE